MSDLIEGILRFAFSTHHGPMNIGNPAEMTVLDFAEKIIQLTGSRSKIVFKALPVDDPKVRQPNIDLAKKVLKWEPVVNLEDGLPPVIEYFRSKMGK